MTPKVERLRGMAAFNCCTKNMQLTSFVPFFCNFHRHREKSAAKNFPFGRFQSVFPLKSIAIKKGG